MIKFETVKKFSELKLEGITIEVECRDGQPFSITFLDGAGHLIRVARGDYSGMSIMLPEKPKMIKRWAVRGDVYGMKADEVFESEYEAQKRCDFLNSCCNVNTLKPVEISVPEPE